MVGLPEGCRSELMVMRSPKLPGYVPSAEHESLYSPVKKDQASVSAKEAKLRNGLGFR